MIDVTSNRLLMSDSIRGIIPDLEDDVSQIVAQASDSFIITALEIHGDEAVVGSLDGISVDERIVKLDVKLKLEQAYQLFNQVVAGKETTCEAVQLHLGDKMSRVPGPFKLVTPKMFGIDANNKMCVLAVDLIRI
jgi:hypothetical protein